MLQVIKSKDIRPGEPRWFCSSMEDAQACMKNMQVGDLHTDDAVAVDCVGQEFAIVDRLSPAEREVLLDELLHLHEDLGGYRNPRDPARIDPILGRLRAAWLAHPDQRLGQLLVNSLVMPTTGTTPAVAWGRLYNTECAEFGATGAPIEWPAASTDQPPPVLDFDEVERAIWSVEHAAEVRSGVTRSCNALRAALRPVIAEARAAVALRVDKAALVKHIDYNPSLRIRECAELRAEVTRLTAELAEMSARAREADAACGILGAANGETLTRAAQRVVADARMGAAEIAAARDVEAERNQLRNTILHLSMALDVEAVKAESCAEGWRLLAVATLAEVRKLAAARAVPPDVEAAIADWLPAVSKRCGGDVERANREADPLRAAIARTISDATATTRADLAVAVHELGEVTRAYHVANDAIGEVCRLVGAESSPGAADVAGDDASWKRDAVAKVRALVEASKPATVGGLLATAPVGSIVEWLDGDGDWNQAVACADDRIPCAMHRWRMAGRWCQYGGFDDAGRHLRLPARLVPAHLADADPATRGDLPTTVDRCGVCAQVTANQNHEPVGAGLPMEPTCDACLAPEHRPDVR